MVFHTHKVGLSISACVYVLLFYADYALVYQVIDYGGAHKSVGKTCQALLAHFLVVMSIFCHLRTMLSDPGYVPLPQTKIDFSSDFEKSADTNKKKRLPPPIDQWTVCTKCETYRPPRSHHCRKCGRCVRRMDHHCPWTNNCIGELNFKYFFLFLVYIGSFCLYSVILIIHDWSTATYQDSKDRIMTLILFFESVIFGMFVTAIASGQTIAIVCDRNALEIRRYGAPTKFPKTPPLVLIQAVCGRGSKLLWLLPCVKPRIPDPVPPEKYSMFSNNSVHVV